MSVAFDGRVFYWDTLDERLVWMPTSIAELADEKIKQMVLVEDWGEYKVTVFETGHEIVIPGFNLKGPLTPLEILACATL